MQSIDFEIKNGVLIYYNGKGGNVVIPDSVTVIRDGVFCCCHDITSVHIPDSVTEIGYRAFSDCSSLTSVNIPNSVTKIGEYAFSNCIELTSIVIPDSVTEIGNGVFAFCISLTSINIPDSVNKIGDKAFQGCSSLTSINIPDSVTKIGWGVFRGCIGLTSINIPDAVVGNISYMLSGTKIKRVPQGNIAYKGFNANMTCRDFQYEEGKTYVCEKAKLCDCGFHACMNPIDCFGYYYGENAIYHEVVLEDRTGEMGSDSKVCGRKITIGRRLTLQEMISIFNKLNN